MFLKITRCDFWFKEFRSREIRISIERNKVTTRCEKRKSFEYRHRSFFPGFGAFCRKSREGRCNGYTQMMRGLFIFLHTSREDTKIKSWEKHLRVVDGKNLRKRKLSFFLKWKYVKDVLEVDWMLMDFSFGMLTFPGGSDFWAFLKFQSSSLSAG